MIVADGSGCRWDIGAGWGGVVIDRHTRGRKLLSGGWSTGTISIAEIMPFLEGLAWYNDNAAKAAR